MLGRLDELGVLVLVRHPERHRQVVGADDNGVDPAYVQDRLEVLHGRDALDADDDHHVLVTLLQVLLRLGAGELAGVPRPVVQPALERAQAGGVDHGPHLLRRLAVGHQHALAPS